MLVLNLHRLVAALGSRDSLMFWWHKAAISIKRFAHSKEFNLEFNPGLLIPNLSTTLGDQLAPVCLGLFWL